MKKLFAQIVKFGIVGFISFGIDYVTGLIVLNPVSYTHLTLPTIA